MIGLGRKRKYYFLLICKVVLSTAIANSKSNLFLLSLQSPLQFTTKWTQCTLGISQYIYQKCIVSGVSSFCRYSSTLDVFGINTKGKANNAFFDPNLSKVVVPKKRQMPPKLLPKLKRRVGGSRAHHIKRKTSF